MKHWYVVTQSDLTGKVEVWLMESLTFPEVIVSNHKAGRSVINCRELQQLEFVTLCNSPVFQHAGAFQQQQRKEKAMMYETISPERLRELERSAFGAMTSDFASRMKMRLQQKMAEGKKGWDSPAPGLDQHLQKELRKNLDKQDWVDVACYAMLLWNREAPPKPVATSAKFNPQKIEHRIS